MIVEAFKNKNWIRMISLCALSAALFSGYAFARGGHGGSADTPAWMSFLVLGAIVVCILVISAHSTIKKWKGGQHFKSILSLAIFLGSLWLVYFLINWKAIWEWATTLGLLVGATSGYLIGIGVVIFIFGFAIKCVFGLFFRKLRDVRTEDFLAGIATAVGGVIALLFMYASMIFLLAGIPAFIVVKILELIGQ